MLNEWNRIGIAILIMLAEIALLEMSVPKESPVATITLFLIILGCVLFLIPTKRKK